MARRAHNTRTRFRRAGMVVGVCAAILVVWGVMHNGRTDHPPATTFASVDVATFKSQLDSETRVLDVRTPEEYAAGHIAGATNIDFYAPDFREKLAELDRKVAYALYCRSGNRSGQTLTLMQELGFERVVNLRGGVVAWTDAGNRLCTEATGTC